MKELSIVVMESTPLVFESLRAPYEIAFKQLGYAPVFYHVPTESMLVKVLKSKLIHVAICDLSMGDTEDFLGLNVVQALKTDYPDILCIGNTRGDLYYQQTKFPSFDIFVNKRDLINMGRLDATGLEKGSSVNEDKKYFNQIVEQLRALLHVNPGVVLTEDSDLSKTRRFKSLSDRDLLSILTQVTFTSHDDDASTVIRRVRLTPLSGGRSASDVFRLDALSDDKLRCIPAVLKISDREYADAELANYHKFVKWILPYTWRVDVLGAAFTKRYGAICYSFVLSETKDFESLTYFIELGKDKMVEHTIDTILNPSAKRWYGLLEQDDNLQRRYYNRFFGKESIVRKAARSFGSLVQISGVGRVLDNSVNMDGNNLPTPQEAFLSRPHGRFLSCICHGDLNSNNILLTEAGDIIFIDFQHTGRGHVFEDFIMLEISIRLNYPETEGVDFSVRMRGEEALLRGEVLVELPWTGVVCKIRSAARQNFSEEPFKNYILGLGIVAFSMVRYEGMPVDRKFRMVSCIIFALAELCNS